LVRDVAAFRRINKASNREDELSEIEKLDVLAARINEEHRQVEVAVTTTLSHAIRVGRLLYRAKESVPHGSWGAWLAENFEGSERTARVYMRVYTHREELVDNRQKPATLSLDDALKVLSTPKDAPQSERAGTLEELEGRSGDAPGTR
jgi:hypothetical protein